MTKNDIYEQVVRLTAEIAKTNIAERIFDAVAEENVRRVDTILHAFPDYYPELSIKIKNFSLEFKRLIGESSDDKYEESSMRLRSEWFMETLSQNKDLEQVVEAAYTGDTTKLQEAITNFKKKKPTLDRELVGFIIEYGEYKKNHQYTGGEGAIFGTKADEKNGVFVFDTNVIDALSFYVFTILADIDDIYFFYSEEIEEDGEKIEFLGNDEFVDAIEKATNEAFATFVANYNLLDWVGGEYDEYQSVGEILVDAFADRFEDDEEE